MGVLGFWRPGYFGFGLKGPCPPASLLGVGAHLLFGVFSGLFFFLWKGGGKFGDSGWDLLQFSPEPHVFWDL